MDNEDKIYEIEMELKFIIYENEQYYSKIPNNIIIQTIKKKNIVMDKIPIDISYDQNIIYIDDYEFDCQLYNSDTSNRIKDNKVILNIIYYDNYYDQNIKNKQMGKLLKYIEGLLLGYREKIDDYEKYPELFFEKEYFTKKNILQYKDDNDDKDVDNNENNDNYHYYDNY